MLNKALCSNGIGAWAFLFVSIRIRDKQLPILIGFTIAVTTEVPKAIGKTNWITV